MNFILLCDKVMNKKMIFKVSLSRFKNRPRKADIFPVARVHQKVDRSCDISSHDLRNSHERKNYAKYLFFLQLFRYYDYYNHSLVKTDFKTHTQNEINSKRPIFLCHYFARHCQIFKKFRNPVGKIIKMGHFSVNRAKKMAVK